MPLLSKPWPALAVLCLPLAALAAWLTHTRGPQSLAAFIVSTALLLVLIGVLARTWRLFLLILLPALLLSTAFAIYTLSYDMPPGEFLAYVLATSTWEEIRGFFVIWQGMRWLLVIALLAVVYLALAARVAPRPIFAGSNRGLRWSLIGVMAALGAYAASSPAALLVGLATNPLIGTVLFIFNPLAHARAAVNGSAIAKVPFGAAHVQSQEVHILVIGESARRDSWSVYGYGRQTTPYLETLRGEAIFLQHAVADANFTVCVVPILLTGMNPAQFDMGNIRGNVVDLAEEAGYSTAWLMNQDPHISLLTGVHADHMVYPPAISTLMAGHLPRDEVLLPELSRELANPGRPRFIGLHSIGSHWEYDTRYPPAFERFGSGQGLDYLSVLRVRSDPRVLNAYDNSVAYTDWFLQQVIEQVRRLQVPATVTYMADHGEDLYLLDGNTGHGTATYTRHQFDIPAFVWLNGAYRQAHPQIVQALLRNADKEIRSHNLLYSLADLMGIHWPGEKSTESFASPDFIPDRSSPHIAGGTLVSGMDHAAPP